MIEWILQNYEALIAGAAMATTMGTAAAYPAIIWASGYAGDVFGQLVDLVLEAGDDEWDDILRRVVAKIQKDIPDDISEDHPKIVSIAARWSRRSRFLKPWFLRRAIASFLRSVDQKAKKYKVWLDS